MSSFKKNNFHEKLEKLLDEASKFRNKKLKKTVNSTTKMRSPSLGDYLRTYACCLFNRQLDIYDDAVFLLENNKVESALVISRGMIEVSAYALCLTDKASSELRKNKGKDGARKATDIILAFINSSKVKEINQKQYNQDGFDKDSHHWTEEAKYRMENMLASSEHVMNSLRFLFKDERQQMNKNESVYEKSYVALSEWVHPSQGSIYHKYVEESHMVETSVGLMHFQDAAKFSCAQALNMVTYCDKIYDKHLELAMEIDIQEKRGG